MICDILLLADPFLKLSTENELIEQANNDNIAYLPISRANTNPNSYWKLDDSVFDLIHKSTDPNLLPARQLIHRMKRRKLYKLCGEHDIEDEEWEKKLWAMNEDEIVSKMLERHNSSIKIKKHFIIIEKRDIHHGMGASDPVSCVRFVQAGDQSELNKVPNELPTAVQLKVHACLTPKSFLMQTIRVYCRVDDDTVANQIHTCFTSLIELLQRDSVRPTSPKNLASSFEIEDGDSVDENNVANMQNEYNVLTQSPIADTVQSQMSGKRSNTATLFSQAISKKGRMRDR
jgi:hypothetical protein